jgi:hypothetical protein
MIRFLIFFLKKGVITYSLDFPICYENGTFLFFDMLKSRLLLTNWLFLFTQSEFLPVGDLKNK